MSKRKETSTYSKNENLVAGCDLSFAVSLIDARWKLQIIFTLEGAKRRFSDIRKEYPHITDRVLAMQLRALEKDGLIRRTIYAEIPPRVEYELSEMGMELIPILNLLSQWGGKQRQLLITSDN